MTDPTQFIVQHSWVHRVMNHQGILGKGRDFLTNKPCSLHYYSDSFKRNYVMQIYEGIDSQFLTVKLNRMAKNSHSQYVSNMTRPCMYSSRKTNKGLYDFSIFYDVTGIYGMSLQSVIAIRSKNKEKFTQEQLNGFFWQIADMFLLSSRNTLEYLQITPMNVFCKIQGLKGYNFFPNNFGLHFSGTKWEKKYYNPEDEFWNGKRTPQSAVRAVMFMLGMVLLQMSSLLSPDQLYQGEKEEMKINEKALSKRIQGIRLINDQLICNAIKKMLVLNQNERLRIQQIYSNSEWMKLRRVDYVQNKAKLSDYKTFFGLVSFEKDFAVGQAIDKQMCLLRGTFRNNVLDGPSVKQSKNGVIQIGIFQNGQLKQGQQVVKNKHITIGCFKDNQPQNGIRISLNIGMLNKQHKKIISFTGQFKDNQPFKGTIYYSDGSKQKL